LVYPFLEPGVPLYVLVGHLVFCVWPGHHILRTLFWRVEQCVLCMIWGFCHKVVENCALLGYYTASSGNFFVLKHQSGITTTWCVITQKSTVLNVCCVQISVSVLPFLVLFLSLSNHLLK
jgi:hypothetical protein